MILQKQEFSQLKLVKQDCWSHQFHITTLYIFHAVISYELQYITPHQPQPHHQ